MAHGPAEQGSAAPEEPLPPDGETTHGSGAPSAADWLLGATESRDRSRTEWQAHGVTMLMAGVVFSAIRMSARLIQAAAGTDDIKDVDHYLTRALVGGPVIHDPRRCRYYALVPADSRHPWEPTRDLEPLGPGAYVGVPRPGLNAPTGSGASYWAVPMTVAGTLCAPSVVAVLVEIGRYRLASQPPVADDQVSPLPMRGHR